MKKIIHYCWFGGKPLPKMARKCIKSWKKFFPDYEIKEWNETNFDINICPFVKEAYENKKWAFVSDYVRIYALYNYGGIYFDTDLEVLKNVDFLMNDDIFMGKEDSGYIATCVIGVKEEKNKHIKEILDYYERQEHFDVNNTYYYANPLIITRIFNNYEKKVMDNGVELIDDSIHIYPRDYFCPLDYCYSERVYTENTCMIHYFNATWTPKGERLAVTLFRTFGMKWGNKILKVIYFFSGIKNKILGKLSNYFYLIKLQISIHVNINKRVKKVESILKENKGEYLAIYHPDWIGVSNATKDAFKYTVPIREQYTEKEAKRMANVIVESNVKMVIFNAFAKGWEYIAENIKQQDKNIKIKVLWHGSHALLAEEYDWDVFSTIIKYYNKEVIDELGFVKKSMYDFYKQKGFNTSFVMNTIEIENKESYYNSEKVQDKIKVGLYSSGDRWVKNTYNQVSAVSLLKNAVLDSLPLSNKTSELCKIFNLELTGTSGNIKREELFKRMASNDINIYVTFTECAPLIPLESLELGVPCITGDNHHYFENTELEKYLVVNKEDNIVEIYNKIVLCLENKEKILDLYKAWKEEYDKKAIESRKKFVEI